MSRSSSRNGDDFEIITEASTRKQSDQRSVDESTLLINDDDENEDEEDIDEIANG